VRLAISPVTLKEGCEFVRQNHRHHPPPRGGLFAIAAIKADEMVIYPVVGVVIVGRPVARMLDDDVTAEVTRLATDGSRNACSMLYRAAWRACRAMGYQRLVTFTLASEPGSSLRGAGFRCIGEAGGGTWSRPSRPRVDMHPTQAKLRWEITDCAQSGSRSG
jgi:hypothetical protein